MPDCYASEEEEVVFVWMIEEAESQISNLRFEIDGSKVKKPAH